MIVSKRVTYRGRVQGVGFRYTAQGLATDFKVAGYVRNLPNGNVELVAEGAADQVDAYLDAIARRMADFIASRDVQEGSPEGFHRFRIRY